MLRYLCSWPGHKLPWEVAVSFRFAESVLFSFVAAVAPFANSAA
jgi:hypothetical protein